MKKQNKKLTIQDLFDLVWKSHWDSPRYHKSGHAAEVKRNFEIHIRFDFLHDDVRKITRSDVLRWQLPMKKIPIAGNRSLEVLSRMFNFAIEHELLDSNPCTTVKSFTEKSRKRYASEDELKKICELLDKSYGRSPRGVTFLYTLLFTGARPRSLERARWRDLSLLDYGFGLLTFDGKSTAETGEQESVLIPPEALEKIFKLSLSGKSLTPDTLIFGIKKPRELWTRIRNEAGCPDLWARDFRRTFATIAMSNNIPMDQISELLNHKSVQTTKIYAKLDDRKRVENVRAIAEKMTSILSGKNR